jgi:RNA polymerase sigma factor (sigma-70 family)
MADRTLETLFARYSQGGDIDALAEVFDRVAPDLERLARRLVADRHRADDLVQATFLTALERPGTFEAGRALRPWLLGILVNRASVDRRKAERTPEVDRLEPREVESPLAATSESETREVVARAIADLPPKLRRVVEARLIEETDTATLAEELAISRGALRVRLHRGLERLRRALPPSLATVFAALFIHSRGLAQVRSHVLQEAARQAGGSAVAAASAGAIGMGALMSKKLVGGVAAALLIVLATVIYQLEPPAVEATDDLTRVDVDVAAAPVERNSAELVSSRVEVPDTTDATPSGYGRVAAQVAHADGSPAVGFEVVVRHAEVDGAKSTVARTNETGLASVDLPAATRLISVEVLGTPTTTPDKQWTRQRLADGERVEVELRVTDGWPLSGTVVDEDGQPVAGAEVLGWNGKRNSDAPDRVVKADASGRFRLEHLGPDFVATARADGLACNMGLRGELSDRVEAQGLTIELARSRRLHGIVLTPNRVPVEGARVSVSNGLSARGDRDSTHIASVTTFWAGEGSDTTDARGHFEIRDLPRSRASVSVDHEPYLLRSETLDTGDEPVEIILDAGLSLRGQVLDSSGKPALDAKVRSWPGARAITYDGKGGFELDGLPHQSEHEAFPRVYGVAATLDGHAVQVVQPVEPDENGGNFVEIRLEPERVLAGRVLGEDGQPVAGVEVWVEGEREMNSGATWHRRSTWEFCNGLDEQQTDREGRFRFEKLYPGEFTLHAISPADPAVSVEGTAVAGDESIELRFDRAAMRKVALVGEVRDLLTGEPIQTFRLQPFIGSRALTRTVDSPDGHFEVIGPSPGPIRFCFEAEGYARRCLPEREYAAGDHQLLIELAPIRSVELSIVDETGEPYLYGSVQAFDSTGEKLMFGPPGGMLSDTQNLLDHKALMHGLPAELITLQVSVGAARASNVHDFPIDLTHPLDAPLVLTVPRRPDEELTSLQLAALVMSTDLDPKLARERLAEVLAGDQDAREWLRGAFESGLLSEEVEDTLEIRATHDGRQFGKATITPQAEGGFLVETSSSASKFGGVGFGSEGSNVFPKPLVRLGMVPSAPVRIEVNSTRYRPIDRVIDCSAAAAPELEFLLLQEL